MGSLTHVKIDFESSHLIFPTIIACILAVLGLAILVTHRKAILASGTYWQGAWKDMDKGRFFGILVTLLVYFSLMEPVGQIWPNTGMGFLICSMPFLFVSGMICLHERTLRALVPLFLIAVAVPVLAWWLFADLFFLTLP